ncbi:cytochrome P450 [Aspergillus eucalypticola CBS 122712]|uniref:Cytochrome P450 n=1 Tax=Aspergillus eucalypticola (strain CBS 122712 / IBT 29274) TaxID=1448314 RepID=A0A317WA24_ASPEC|nr:cytochrome P450 [Aspergillus eucalypticola CBS 122712]PWY82725.1 cytochrome P450 [Aspergillus eucalypticola CBS 122712]
MAASGISGPTRARLWSSITAERKEHIPRAITENVRRALRAQPQSNPLTLKILTQMDKTLTPLAASDPLRRSVSAPAEVSLFRWIIDVFTVTVSDGAFGNVCLDKFPEVLDNMFSLQTNVYAIFTRRPKILAPKAYDACDKLSKILARYFALPREDKVGCADFVTRAENEIRSAGVSQEELAMIMLDNPSTTAFWCLCRMLYDPGLLSAIRKECEEAFSRNSPTTSADIPVQLECCPTLKATVTETLRLHSGTHVFRHVSEDTEIGPYCLKKGSTVLIPYNRLQVSRTYWGPDAEDFNYRRFLDNPELAHSRYFRPFGDGIHQCGGKAMAPQLVMYFVAIVVCRYDVGISGGFESHPFPRIDFPKGRATVPMPVAGDVPHVTLTPNKRAA